MPRIAVYECPCCGGRVSRSVPAGKRAAARFRCEGFCARCDGSCRDFVHLVGVERDQAPTLAPAREVRLVRPADRLDLRDFQPPGRGW